MIPLPVPTTLKMSNHPIQTLPPTHSSLLPQPIPNTHTSPPIHHIPHLHPSLALPLHVSRLALTAGDPGTWLYLPRDLAVQRRYTTETSRTRQMTTAGASDDQKASEA